MRMAIVGVSAPLLALVLWGCEGGTGVVWVPGGPSTAPTITASISLSSVSHSFFEGIGVASPTCDIVIAASRTVDVHDVTMHLIDGSNLGGPMITVPHAELIGQFGTTRVVAGSRRTFTMRAPFESSHHSRGIAVDITVFDARGVVHRVTVDGS